MSQKDINTETEFRMKKKKEHTANEKHPIDAYFAAGLNEAEISPSEDLWARMESQLDKAAEKPSAKVVPIFANLRYYSAAASIVLVLFLGFWFNPFKRRGPAKKAIAEATIPTAETGGNDSKATSEPAKTEKVEKGGKTESVEKAENPTINPPTNPNPEKLEKVENVEPSSRPSQSLPPVKKAAFRKPENVPALPKVLMAETTQPVVAPSEKSTTANTQGPSAVATKANPVQPSQQALAMDDDMEVEITVRRAQPIAKPEAGQENSTRFGRFMKQVDKLRKGETEILPEKTKATLVAIFQDEAEE